MMITSVATVIKKLSEWISIQVEKAGADGVVVGVSGGIDSAVVLGLAELALTARRVTPLWLPCYSSDEDYECALLVAETCGLRLNARDLGPTFDVLSKTMGISEKVDLVVAGNMKARLRMVALRGFANANNLLVLGTTNKTEATFGYFTKGGDGEVDLEPIEGLYKDEVRTIAAHLPGPVPDRIIDRAPSAGLYPGQTDEGELKCSYDELNTFAKAYNGDATLGIMDDALNLRLMGLVQRNQHKTNLPPVCYIREDPDFED